MNGSSHKREVSRKPAVSFARPLREFSEYTTAHGLGRLGAQQTFIGHAIWLLFIVATYCGMAYHMYTLLDRFLAVPLLTGLSTSLPFEFPDVYVCPSGGALSMSKISEAYSLAEVQQLRGLRKACNLSCQRALSKLDIAASDRSGAKAVRLSRVMLALSDTLAATEKSVIDTYRLDYMRLMNLTNCRFTEAGEEYKGSANTVPVYSSSLTYIANKPLVTYQQCMSWNRAAEHLDRSNLLAAKAAAADIRRLGFPDSEDRCRQPRGLPLSKLFHFATRPLQEVMTCVSKSGPGPKFNYSCFTTEPSRITVEMCAECCYVKNFTYIGLQYDHCYCDNDYLTMPVSDNCDIACSGDESQLCGGDAELSVVQVRSSGDSPLMIPFGSNMSRSLGGPYCFYMDEEDGLSASYCDIPFCPAPPSYDCAVSAVEESVDRKQLSAYSGYMNVTTKGRECMVWSTVKRRIEDGSLRLLNVLDLLEEPVGTYTSAKVIALHIQTPDYALSNSTNYCRAVRVLFDAEILSDGTSVVIRDTAVNSAAPGCFYLNEVEDQVFFEICNVKPCYEASPGVSGTIRDRVGRALLTRQFSGGMTIGFTDCRFFTKRCTRADFENVQHPELGVCHRFVKENFVDKLTRSQVAEAQLELKYFTDSSDSLGRRFENISKMSGVVHNGLHAQNADTALTVIIVPDGVYPWTANSISVSPAQSKGVLLRHDKTVRFSKPPKLCLKSLPPVTYAITSWFPNVSKEADLPASYTEAVFNESNWSDKIDKLKLLLQALSAAKGPVRQFKEYRSVSKEHCINQYVLKQFISNCNCLPSFLPIPIHLAQASPLCFNQTDAESLYLAEQCYKKQLDNIELYRMSARSDCQPPCETPSYSIREVAHPWPSVKRERALSFLAELAGLHGYPNDVKPTRGPVSLYYAYLRALELSRVPLNARNLSDLVDFAYEIDIVQDRLAMITVQASQQFGDEIVEEEAYPVKNLLADMGGALGLWCGVSVLTICEVLELCSILSLALSRQHPGLLRRQSRVSRDTSAYTVPEPAPLPLSELDVRTTEEWKEQAASRQAAI